MHDRSGDSDPPNFDPKVYRIDPKSVRLWNDYVYDPFGAKLDQRIQRACVSFGFGLTSYLVGLAIAVPFDFAAIYVATPGVYILSFSLMFIMGRQRWAKWVIFDRLDVTREALIVSDTEYASELSAIGSQIAPTGRLLLLFLSALAIGWIAVGFIEFKPRSFVGKYLTVLEPPTFSHTWFSGLHLIGKMAIIDWYYALVMFNLIPIVYGTVILVGKLPSTALKWSVVPIPSYVLARFRGLINYYLTGAAVYGVGVLWAVLLYGGTFQLSLIAGVALFSMMGLLYVFLPLYTINRVVGRSREQVAAAVAEEYYHGIYPVAAGITLTRDSLPANRASSAYSDLLRLEELMSVTYGHSLSIYRLDVLIFAILSQGIPFLGFLYPVIARLF
jgi:hypothetical protein